LHARKRSRDEYSGPIRPHSQRKKLAWSAGCDLSRLSPTRYPSVFSPHSASALQLSRQRSLSIFLLVVGLFRCAMALLYCYYYPNGIRLSHPGLAPLSPLYRGIAYHYTRFASYCSRLLSCTALVGLTGHFHIQVFLSYFGNLCSAVLLSVINSELERIILIFRVRWHLPTSLRHCKVCARCMPVST